jgi:hypothetical protein
MGGVELFADMCGTEVWNIERTAAYMRHGVSPAGTRYKGDGCPQLVDLAPLFTDSLAPTGGYELPETDPAPWYDPLVPESRNFAGVIVNSAVLSPAADRDLSQNAGHGAVLTRPRFRGRTLDVKATLVGKTCCAVTYGLRWLTQALLGAAEDSCDDCTLSFLSCCPATGGEDGCLVLLEDGSPVPYYRMGFEEEWQRGTDFARQVHGAGLLSGPDVVALHSGRSCGCGCGTITEVEFVVGLQSPWLNCLPSTVASDVAVGLCGGGDDCLEFVKCPSGSPGCPPLSTCDDDPACAETVPAPPVRPPRRACGCVPLVAERSLFAVPAASGWFEQVLVVELSAGSSLMRNVVVRVWPNPDGLECDDPDAFPDCAAAGTLIVDYVPAGGTLRFDSAARKVTMTCDGFGRTAERNITTVDGLPFDWLTLGRGACCVAVDTDCTNVAEDASATLLTVRREL